MGQMLEMSLGARVKLVCAGEGGGRQRKCLVVKKMKKVVALTLVLPKA